MSDERKSSRGRPRLGDDEKAKFVKFSITLTPELFDRLCAYCEADEREKAWAIRKALDPWLKERGY